MLPKNPVLPSIFDGLGMGLGFTVGLVAIGLVREILGSGKAFGAQIIPVADAATGAAGYTPITIFILAPGAFLVLAGLAAIQNKVKINMAKKGKDVSKKTETAAGMGGAVVFVITIASFVAGLLYKFILVPTHFEYLKTIVFILVIAALVQIVEMFLKKFVPSLYKALGVYLPLITTNCAVLGVALNNVKYEYSILESVVNGFATGVGYLIAIVLLAGIREKMEYNDIPESFQGMPIVLLTAALMAIAFFGFSGIV